tara:strand:+ start:199 stop:396 length:198 start_codon:yes stop_codon:yes gene_type:complete
MLIVKLKKGENINSAVKRMKKKVRNTRLIQELRGRQAFLKPSVIKRKAKQKAVYKQEWLRKNGDV